MLRLPCRYCGGNMTGRAAAARYCSDECKDESKILNAKPRKREKAMKSKRIEAKWLVRGNISDGGNFSMFSND